MIDYISQRNNDKAHSKGNALESPLNHLPSQPVLGKTVSHKTRPWCQNVWAALSQDHLQI